MAKQLPATQQYAPATLEALRNSTSNYDEWSRNQAFAKAQREGRVQYVVHVNTPQVHVHTHVHYDAGKLPRTIDGDSW